MGDPACYMHLLDEDGRMPEPVFDLPPVRAEESGEPSGPAPAPSEAAASPPGAE